MKTKILALFLTLAFMSGFALAAPRTAILDVQNMTCAVCPITIKKALEHVSGVLQVTVDYASKSAIVEFDDRVATADKLTDTTKNAGYPSSIKAGKK